MYSTIVWIALAGFTNGTETQAPRWLNDYSQAKQAGQNEKKPVLVVVGTGGEGWAKLSQSGKLDKQVNHILSQSYVCVYADINTAEGWRLARALGLTTGMGIAISDRSGRFMAFFHEGNLADDTMTRYLQRYADPGRAFVGTETNPNGALHNYAPAYNPAPASFSRSC